MATNPRAGIINLNFKDVSEMAKNIADNDPWKLGIDAAGKVLTDRERYIMYQRALADAQGKERPEDKTAGELIGSGIDGVGSALSWLKDKWDRLDIRSPFEETLTPGTVTESPITETPSEKGSREMIGYKPNQSPIETDKYRTNLKAPGRADVQPNDELSFGFSQDVGQAEEKPSPIIPFATGEQIPEQTGTKVDFGTSEPTTKLRSPFAMRPKEEAQESTSPFGSTEVAETKMKAPRMTEMEAWSEMNRLDPQRAAFDWNRIAPKGSGAAGTVQARLEHDSKIDQEIAAESAALRKDMLANGWTSSSPEFLDRYATIMDLEAQKFVKGTKNDLTRLIGLSDKEFAQDQSKTKAELDAKKQDFAEKKEMTDIDQKAFEVTNSVMGDLLKKQYDKPAQLQATAADLRNAVADPNNINEASIKKAVKAFIQSIDNSVVMSFEAQSFADSSALGKIMSRINSLVDDNIYSPERLGEIWDNMVSSLAAYNTIADSIVTTAKDFYTQYGGKNVGVIDKWGSLIKANSSLGPKPDFSRVKTWWEKYQLGDKNSENSESVYAKDMKSPPKAWSKKTSGKGKAPSTVYDENSSTEGF